MNSYLFPIREGSSPPTKYFWGMFSRAAKTESTRATSTICPLPVLSLTLRAERIPMQQNRELRMSPIAVPDLVGGESGQPVMLRRPPIAWPIMS